MSYIIYLHRNKINNKVYIGQTKNSPKRRWENGQGYQNTYFGNAISKYGWQNFQHEILVNNIQTVQEANKIETYYIQFYDSTNREKGYNICQKGGCYNTQNRPVSDYSRKKSSQTMKKLWEDPNFRMRRSQKVKCIETNQIFNSYKEAGQWCGLIQYKNCFTSYFRGEKFSCGKHPETKQPLHWVKIDINGQEKIDSQNFDKAKTFNFEYRKRPVICINTGEEFQSLEKAIEWCGLKNTSSIINNIKGRTKSAGKHPTTKEKLYWKYKQ